MATSTPLSQYLARHAEYLLETPPKAGLINADNLIIRASDLKCAAFELPFERGEEFGPGTADLLDLLVLRPAR